MKVDGQDDMKVDGLIYLTYLYIFDLYLMVFDLFIRIYLSVLLSCCLDMLLTFEIKCTVRPFL